MRHIELRHLRSFVCTAKHLHFARAAEELGIAPPSLTKLIQEAEQILGVRLFQRTKRSVALTAAGEAWQAEAQAALDHLARGEDLARRAERGELGKIKVGYVGSAVYAGILQSTVKAFRHKHTSVEFDIQEVAMGLVGKLLNDGSIDVAYARPPMHFPEGIDTLTVYRDVFVLALPSDSPLAGQASVEPAHLGDQRFVLPEQEYGTLEVARRGGFTPNLGPRPGPLAAVLARVSLGGDVAVVPNTLAQCVALPGVVYRPILGEPIPSEVAIAYRCHEKAPAVRTFLRHCQSNESEQ